MLGCVSTCPHIGHMGWCLYGTGYMCGQIGIQVCVLWSWHPDKY